MAKSCSTKSPRFAPFAMWGSPWHFSSRLLGISGVDGIVKELHPIIRKLATTIHRV